jgi:Asp-tRNA(Asn)/Glu-tRNA(Gln) amidotransferase A subunit family amidase
MSNTKYNHRFSAGLILGLCFAFALGFVANQAITDQTINQAASLIGLEFTQSEVDTMLSGLEDLREDYQTVREHPIPNSVEPVNVFNPIPTGAIFDKTQHPIQWDLPEDVQRPNDLDELAFYSVTELASLIKNKKVTSVELTRTFLDRLKAHDSELEAVITLLEDRAMERAQAMDQELANGNYRGPLHGIPYGIKDLFALQGYKTTWGATPYKHQMIDQTATVITKLEDAGAVLVAKLTLGALAYGDIWYGGRTNNPWNLEQGSSGSSAGSAAATSAGLVPFAIGTETLGSIVSPSNRTGTTGLRPTFGRVSRYGAMALSWSMDKIGPITRSAEDLALVFNNIYGPDQKDPSVIDMPFNYPLEIDFDTLTIGYFKSAFESDYENKERDQATLETLEALGATLKPIELPDLPVNAIGYILNAESAAAFDVLTRSDKDDQLKWQRPWSWPNLFRQARFIPAVEYINANRIRRQLIDEMHQVMQEVDLYVSPTYGGSNLLVTNLTGHPCVVLPNGFREDGTPTSITFIGKLFDEGTIIYVGQAYQEATDFDDQHPERFM